MFERPPSILMPLWNALSDISAWFNWDALAAIGTVGALWFAVVQTSRNARAERVRSVGLLTMLIGLIEPVAEFAPMMDPKSPRPKKDKLLASDAKFALPIVKRALVGLERISVSDVASVGASEYVFVLPQVLEALQKHLTKIPSHPLDRESYEYDAEYVAEACAFLRDKRDYIRYGYLGAIVRRKGRDLRDRLTFWWLERKDVRALRGPRSNS